MNKKCIIKSEPQRMLANGYTRVRVLPNVYSKIILISGMTGKTIQDVVDELLAYAISETQVECADGKLLDIAEDKK